MVQAVVGPRRPLNELRLEVVFPENGDDCPRVLILIDGEDRLSHAGRTDWVGFDPSEVFASKEVLLPGVVPCRVAVYQCSCGEPGCGSLAPVIESDGENLVRWTDFQDFTGVFDGPRLISDPEDEDPFSDGHPLAVDDLVFNRQQYEAEIVRAAADMSWESDGRATARLLGNLVRKQEAPRMKAANVALVGVTFDWSSNGDPTWTMQLRPVSSPEASQSFRQMLMTLPVVDGSPERQAQSLFEMLQSIPESNWGSNFPYRYWP